jgi:hypothetical protein
MQGSMVRGIVINLCLVFSSSVLYAQENHLFNFINKVADGTQQMAKGIIHGTERALQQEPSRKNVKTTKMEEAKPGEPNTDWGAVDPTQQNVPGYFNLKPGEKYLDPVESPRNNNWYLLTLGARRGLTFLEQQKEVDPEMMGLYGHSMGGNLTVYVAGTDDRVKVAAPSVGGSGFRTQPWPLLPEQRKESVNGDVGLFDATIGFESYAPHITAPLLWLGATNDFHGIMDDTYRTGELIPHQNVRYAFTPHMNHRFTPEFAVARPLWIDQFLKGSFTFPGTPESKLVLTAEDGVPVLEVTPDTSLPIERVQLLYSVDPDPQARFWRTAQATQDGTLWIAKLPILSVEQPLLAFANVYYKIPKNASAPQAEPSDSLAISSMLHTATPDDLRREEVKPTDARSSLIDEFSHGWQDWYTLSANNPHHWEYSTRKLNDPKWQGQPDEKLAFEVRSEHENELVIVLTENFFRSYRAAPCSHALQALKNTKKKFQNRRGAISGVTLMHVCGCVCVRV